MEDIEHINKLMQGKVVTGIQLSDDAHAIRFIMEGGSVIQAETDADCCSHTWIEHIEVPTLGFPFRVIEAQNIDLPHPNLVDWGLIQFYGFKLVTDKGEFVLDYRNESNGYYGGWLKWPGDDSWDYGGVFGQNKLDDSSWTDVKENI